jgi:hypothetical protein
MVPLNYLVSQGGALPRSRRLHGRYATSSHFTLIISVRVAFAAWRRKPITAGNLGDLLLVARSRGGAQWLCTGVGISTLVPFFSLAGTFVVVATVIVPVSRPLLTTGA